MYKNLILIFLLAGFSYSCTNDQERGDVFECTIDGEKFTFKNLNAYATYDSSGDAYSIYGTEDLVDSENARTVYIILNDDLGTGNYTLGSGKDGNGYFLDQNQTFSFYTIPAEAGGNLEITKKTDKQVKGNFSFTAIDPNSLESVEISSGSFDVTIRE